MESLANELLLDIFEYFTAVELLQAFHRLNDRFNQLISQHFRKCPLDLRSIAKGDFHSICQDHLPFIINRIPSMHLSNEDKTPNQVNLFFSIGFHLENLQSLSLDHVHSTNFINDILSQCPNLIDLNISKCNFDEDNHQAKICLNRIWSLVNLRSCYLNDIFVELLNVTSLSIRHLSIENHLISFKCLNPLFQHTPALENLTINIRDVSDDQPFTSNISSLRSLTIDCRGEFDSLKNLLEHLPNLSTLIIRSSDIYINGYQWEAMIGRLKIFRLFMSYQFDITKDIDEEFDHLFQSFRTKFWLEEHQWFIRCDCHSESQTIYLYTLPYRFPMFGNYDYDRSESTCEMERRFQSLTSVKNLIFENYLARLDFQFPNIESLELAFPFADTLWSVMPNFNRLKSLEIISMVHADEFDQSILRLRQLLNQAIHLYSLTIDYLILSQLSITNQSIHRLDLMVSDGHFYNSECIAWIQSLLNDRCEVLLINVENRSIILDLIVKLPKLRALIFQCQDDHWGDSADSFLHDDELIQWLRNSLSSTCSITRDDNEISVIRLWIQ